MIARMSIRHLDALFDPHSVALIGASDRPGSVGATVWRNLRSAGFEGPCWPVNPRRDTVGGEHAYARVAALPSAPELAVVCVPPAAVPGVIAELGERGTRAAVVLTAGLSRQQQQAMLDAARPHLLRILGPNGLGLIAPHARLNASFAHVGVPAGGLAFVSQSGALVTAMLDWAQGRGIGFSHCVSLGEHADVDFADLLDWLASDARTQAILLYIESIEGARKFMSAARAAARNKPVLVVKAGRSPQGAAAARSHTGALAASDLVFDAAIRRAGMLRVDTLQQLFDAAETLAHARAAPAAAESPRTLMIVTNGGGAGVMAADAAAAAGVPLAELTPGLRATLDAVLPPNWSRANPVDIIGDAPAARYAAALQALLEQPPGCAVGAVLFMHAPTAIVPASDIAEALLPLVARHPGRVLAGWLGEAAVRGARQAFQASGVPCYATPEAAVAAFAQLQTYRDNQAALTECPPLGGPVAVDTAQVAAVVRQALGQGREWLTEPEAKSLLAACGVPVVGTRVVAPEPAAAVAAARELGLPVVLKILSPQITHKSDVGGVALHLETEAAVEQAARAMLERVQRLQPGATVEGYTVQAMVRRPRALELIVGASLDPLFGPVILFGHGGTAVEVLADRAQGLPPLNPPLAALMIRRTRVARLLAGWRDVPAADIAAVERVLVAVSELMAAEPRITELDINPLLADADGVIALDARVRVSAAAPGGAARFAIRPYPAQQVQRHRWQGRELTIRPIRPEDEPQHLSFLERLSPEDIRMRVFYSRRTLPRTELARLVQIDYEREMAFVATVVGEGGTEETLGTARAACDPDNDCAEFGVIVRSDVKGQGLGRLLMEALIAHLRQRGTQRLVGEVLTENRGMRMLCQRLGFAEKPDGDVVCMSLALRPG
jgi:acetyltransferase